MKINTSYKLETGIFASCICPICTNTIKMKKPNSSNPANFIRHFLRHANITYGRNKRKINDSNGNKQDKKIKIIRICEKNKDVKSQKKVH